MSGRPRVLVIKLSSLGDVIQAMGPFAAIRAHHADARITLLTTRPYAELAAASPWFDEVWVDERPPVWDLRGLLRLRKRLRSARFDMVYDLQTSERSSSYFHIMGRPPWSGIAAGCSHPHDNPDRDLMHTLDRQAEQLARAGIAAVPPPDLSWLGADIGRFALPRRFVLFVPGGAPHRPAKRWPPARFAELGGMLAAQGAGAVLLGTESDAAAAEAVRAGCASALSLVGRTGFADIAELARRAAGAVGNDTGPMHLIAAVGCPCVVLFSAESDPALCAPRGSVTAIRRTDLAALPAAEVAAALAAGPARLRSW